MKQSNLELLEVIEKQQEIINQQHQTIGRLTNENAEQESLINSLINEEVRL